MEAPASGISFLFFFLTVRYQFHFLPFYMTFFPFSFSSFFFCFSFFFFNSCFFFLFLISKPMWRRIIIEICLFRIHIAKGCEIYITDMMIEESDKITVGVSLE